MRVLPASSTTRSAGTSRDVYRTCWELRTAQGAAASEHIRYVEFGSWITSFNINYFMGADGLSLPLVWLTALLGILCIAYSWNIEKGTKAYFALFLILETGLMGVFLALDFFLFYVFWEIVLLPMYFLIGIWGGPRRVYAAIKFFIYTLVGSVIMLLCMLALYFHSGFETFNVLTLMEVAPSFSFTMQMYLFLGLFVGFAIKVPVFPFHTWLPDAHVEAPTAASVILAGVLLKMGGYGFFRFSFGLAPNAARGDVEIPIFGNFVIFLAVLGVINIVYGALCAMAQTDFKRLVAYSSVSHMGYVLLGLAAMTDAGIQGAALQMFNHGLSSAMMFLIVGVIYDRAHHRNLTKFGGLATQMPYYTGLATVGFFASLGLPGLNGFISEALCFIGAYESEAAAVGGGFTGMPRIFVYLALPGIVPDCCLHPLGRPAGVHGADQERGLQELPGRQLPRGVCLGPAGHPLHRARSVAPNPDRLHGRVAVDGRVDGDRRRELSRCSSLNPITGRRPRPTSSSASPTWWPPSRRTSG